MLPPFRVTYIWQLLFLKPNCQKMVVYEENFFTTELSYRGVQGELAKDMRARITISVRFCWTILFLPLLCCYWKLFPWQYSLVEHLINLGQMVTSNMSHWGSQSTLTHLNTTRLVLSVPVLWLEYQLFILFQNTVLKAVVTAGGFYKSLKCNNLPTGV